MIHNLNPYAPPHKKSHKNMTLSQGPVTVFVSHEPSERAFIQGRLSELGIPSFLAPIDASNSLALGFSSASGSATMGSVEIQVPSGHAEQAHEAIRQLLPDSSQQPELQLVEPSNPEQDSHLAEKEFRRRMRYAWVFLLPGLIPFASVVAMINANEALRVSRQSPQPLKGTTWAKVALGLGFVVTLAHVGFTAMFLFNA